MSLACSQKHKKGNHRNRNETLVRAIHTGLVEAEDPLVVEGSLVEDPLVVEGISLVVEDSLVVEGMSLVVDGISLVVEDSLVEDSLVVDSLVVEGISLDLIFLLIFCNKKPGKCHRKTIHTWVVEAEDSLVVGISLEVGISLDLRSPSTTFTHKTVTRRLYILVSSRSP